MVSARIKLRAASLAALLVAVTARAATPALAQIELRIRHLEPALTLGASAAPKLRLTLDALRESI